MRNDRNTVGFGRGMITLALLAGVTMTTGCSEKPAVDKARAAVARQCEAPGARQLRLAQEGHVVPKQVIAPTYAAGELTKLCDAAVSEAMQRLDRIAALPAAERTVDNTLLDFEFATAKLNDDTSPLTFMAYVSPIEALRDEGFACEEKVSTFGIGILTRVDLYAALRDLDVSKADPLTQRLHHETVRGFESNGLKLDPAELQVVKDALEKMETLKTQFSKNLNGDTTTVELAAGDLLGVPDAVLKRLKQTADGKYVVPTVRSIWAQVIENARIEDVRKRLLVAYDNRAFPAGNVRLLEDTIALRQDVARRMGYATWADYRTESRMAKNSANALALLNGLKEKLKVRADQDKEQLRVAKAFEIGDANAVLQPWDVLYFQRQIRQAELDLDDEKIREYFPAETVIQGMFNVYQTLLGVCFYEVQGAELWNPDVKLFEIVDAESRETVAYFHADFFPRAGKYGHAAAFTLIQGHATEGGYNRPVSSIVANFNPPADGKPSLLSHDEVETIFHEFGHIMHQTLTRVPFVTFSGSSVARDFVEAPSQMLENWVWQPEVLASLTGHYLRPDEKLPTELLEKMLTAKDFQQGYFYIRQLYLGLMDMAFHTATGPVDTTAVSEKLYREIIGLEPVPGGHFQGTFGHLMGGYDAGYYGYIWSEVFAADMFTRFAAEGVLNSKTGQDYRRAILEQGSAKDPDELLNEFLGRPANSDAFFKKLGIN